MNEEAVETVYEWMNSCEKYKQIDFVRFKINRWLLDPSSLKPGIARSYLEKIRTFGIY